jgi:hypothetical protein
VKGADGTATPVRGVKAPLVETPPVENVQHDGSSRPYVRALNCKGGSPRGMQIIEG